MKNKKIAIVSSGLGHINRGVENWTKETAYLLKDKINIKLFKGGGKKESEIEEIVPNISRNSIILGGIKSPIPWIYRYYVEQITFALMLFFKVKDYDIIQSADPLILQTLQLLKKWLTKKPKILYTNQSSSSVEICKNFEYVQVLAPYYLKLGIKEGFNVKKWFVIPNFVDTKYFCPKKNNNLRKKLNIPIDAFVILSVGPLGFKGHKRMEWLIKEMKIAKNYVKNLYLIIIGDVDKDTEDFINFGKKMLNKNIIFIKNVPHDKISEYYNIADVFVLCSLSEPFGIVFLEAMSCEKPVIGHKFPVTEWIIGNGGITLDMIKEGELADCIKKFYCTNRTFFGKKGRERVKKLFAKEVVAPKFIKMYDSIINSSSV